MIGQETVEYGRAHGIAPDVDRGPEAVEEPVYGQQQAEQAAFGRAVMATWGDLDAKAKERIQEARRNTP